jgi:putative acetyltransferase
MIAVVAYPRFEREQLLAIEATRAAHDPQARRIAAHFTLVFPTDIAASAVEPHAAAVARASMPIPFVLRRAIAVRDAAWGGHVFLVPEEGSATITGLHERLYDETLRPHRRSDIPYVPHVTVGADADWAECEALARRIDAGLRPVSGWIDAISLVAVESPHVKPLTRWMLGTTITIVPYEDLYAEAFARLNRIWLDEHGLFEEADRHHLERPRESILAGGGQIFVAIEDGEVVGVCAMIVRDAATIELAKFAVDNAARGRGIGAHLTTTAIDWARGRGARRVVLVSSTKLDAALRLYERTGFRRGPLPLDIPYATADVFMELAL